MDNPVLETQQLTFYYPRRRPVLENISFRITGGTAFGILGPNGAGKSTLMKLLTGLLRPKQGQAFAFGRPVGREPALFNRIGVLIEEPHLYPHLSGRENLRVFATYRQIETVRVGEVLAMIGLADDADRLVSKYSTGMKQRLAIALALLPDPDLLILDEPTNGLDPQGIAEVRQLVRDLNQNKGKTLLISSHILTEIEHICSHVGILDKGRLRFYGTIRELRDRQPSGQRLVLETDDAAGAGRTLSRAGYEVRNLEAGRIELPVEGRASVPEIIDLLRKDGIALYQVRLEEGNLEEYFLKLLST